MKRQPLKYTPLYPEHLVRLKVCDVQTDEYNALVSHAGLDHLAACTGVTAWAGEECVALVGVFQLWPGRAEAWVLFSDSVTHYLASALPHIKFVLEAMPFKRMEMVVRVQNTKGHQLARVLDFGGSQDIVLPNGKRVRADGLLQAYWPVEGGADDAVMYSRIKRP